MSARLAVFLPMAFVLVAALAGQPALAKGPVTEPFVIPEPTVIEGACEFPVLFTEVVNEQLVTTWPNGKVRVEGLARTRVMNTETGESRLLDTSATVTITQNRDGSTTVRAHGPSLFYFLAGDLGDGQPGALWWMNGLFVETYFFDEETGAFDLVSHSLRGGTKVDMCQVLASGGS